jgi:hypothetical protein
MPLLYKISTRVISHLSFETNSMASVFIIVVLLVISISLIMTNPCPSVLVVHDIPASMSIDVDPSVNQYVDDDNIDDYLSSLTASSSLMDNDQDLSMFNRVRQVLTNNVQRSKRPNWTNIGKRSEYMIKKRPSWARVG